MRNLMVLVIGALLLNHVIAFSKMDDSCDTVKGMPMKNDVQSAPDLLNLKKDLSLTEVQVKQIKELRTDLEKTLTNIHGDVKTVNKEIKAIYGQKIVDFNAARGKIQHLSNIQSQMALEMVNTFEKSYSVLNQEQKEILSKIMSNKATLMKEENK